MSTYNNLLEETPYGDYDDVLELQSDIAGDNYRLQDVIKTNGTHTFSVWYKSQSDAHITFNLSGVSETVKSTNKWNKYVRTFEANSNDGNVYIEPSINIPTYLYEGYLVEGSIDSSWMPSPEDLEDDVRNLRSEISQTATDILLSVSGTYANKEEFEKARSELSIKADRIEQSVSEMQGNLEKASTSWVQSAEDFTMKIEKTEADFQKYTKNYETFIRFSDAGIDIGKLENGASAPFSVNISNEQMSFKQDGVTVAYINHQKLYTTDVHVKNSLIFGTEESGFFDWIPRKSGNLSLVWRNANG